MKNYNNFMKITLTNTYLKLINKKTIKNLSYSLHFKIKIKKLILWNNEFKYKITIN